MENKKKSVAFHKKKDVQKDKEDTFSSTESFFSGYIRSFFIKARNYSRKSHYKKSYIFRKHWQFA